MAADASLENTKNEELRRLHDLMSRRWFVASRRELVAAGFTPCQIKNWLRYNRLTLLLRGVYSFGRDINTRQAALAAALLAAGPGAALTGRTACEQWRIVSRTDRIPSSIQVGTASGEARELVGLSSALSRTGIRVVRRQFCRNEVRRLDGLEVVSPLAALVDFATEASPRELRFAFLEACRLYLVQGHDVNRLGEMMRGRRGTLNLRPLVALLEESTI